MVDIVFLQFLLEPGRAPPVGILPAIVRQQLLGRIIFRGRLTVYLNDMVGRLAPEQVHPYHIPGVIIHIGYYIRVFTAQPEGKYITLPHLVGSGPFKKTGLPGITLLGLKFGRGDKGLLMECLSYCLRAGGQEKQPPQDLGYPPYTPLRILPLQLDNLIFDRGGLGGLPRSTVPGHQPGFPMLLVRRRPAPQGIISYA